MGDRVTVTAETYGFDDDGPDVIVVRVDGRELAAYCIVEDAETERAAMERMVRAVERHTVERPLAAVRETLEESDDG